MRAALQKPVNTRPITPRNIHLRVTSDPANLALVRKEMEALANSVGFDAKACAEIGLCVNEALSNIIRHAYDSRTDQPIHLNATVSPRELHICIRDWGNGIDPSRLPCRPYDPMEPGGVGLICLQQWMDQVSYAPQDDGMITTLIRRLDRA